MARGTALAEINPPRVDVPSTALNPAPVKVIDPDNLRTLGYNLGRLFTQYVAGSVHRRGAMAFVTSVNTSASMTRMSSAC